MRKTYRTVWALLVLLSAVQMGWTNRPMKEALRELKNIPDMKQPEEILRELAEAKPRTKEDIEALSELMETDLAQYAQRLIMRTSDPALAPTIIKICEEKSKGMKKNMTEREFRALSPEDKKKEFNRRTNVGTMLLLLGELKNKKAIPLIEKFLEDEQFRDTAAMALKTMGDEAVYQELMRKTEPQKNTNLSDIKVEQLREIVKEIEGVGGDAEKKARLIDQIKGSRYPEVNKFLKELALHHPDTEVKSRAGLALAYSLAEDPKVGDPDFVVEWANYVAAMNDVRDVSAVMYAVEKTWDLRYVEPLISILRRSQNATVRQEAVRVLAKHRIAEAVPYLEEAFSKDEDIEGVRVAAAVALEQITHKKYYVEVYESDFKFNQQAIEAVRSGIDKRFKLVGAQRP